jgi:hypothetical protein
MSQKSVQVDSEFSECYRPTRSAIASETTSLLRYSNLGKSASDRGGSAEFAISLDLILEPLMTPSAAIFEPGPCVQYEVSSVPERILLPISSMCLLHWSEHNTFLFRYLGIFKHRRIYSLTANSIRLLHLGTKVIQPKGLQSDLPLTKKTLGKDQELARPLTCESEPRHCFGASNKDAESRLEVTKRCRRGRGRL